MPFMPESPFYLVMRGKLEAAKQSISKLRGPQYDCDSELQEISTAVEEQKQVGSISVKELFTKAIYLKPFVIMMFLMGLQQFCGVNALTFNLQKIFSAAHSSLDPGLSATLVSLDQVRLQKSKHCKNIIESLFQVIANTVAVFIIERLGRKVLLFFSNTLIAISLMSLGTYFYLLEADSDQPNKLFSGVTSVSSSSVDSLGWLPLTALIIYFFSFSIGNGPIPYMMNGEIFAPEAKRTCSTVSIAFNWLCAFFVTQFEFDLEDAIGLYGAFFLYGSIAAVSIVILFFIPETKGKSPDDLKLIFMNKKVLRNQS